MDRVYYHHHFLWFFQPNHAPITATLQIVFGHGRLEIPAIFTGFGKFGECSVPRSVPICSVFSFDSTQRTSGPSRTLLQSLDRGIVLSPRRRFPRPIYHVVEFQSTPETLVDAEKAFKQSRGLVRDLIRNMQRGYNFPLSRVCQDCVVYDWFFPSIFSPKTVLDFSDISLTAMHQDFVSALCNVEDGSPESYQRSRGSSSSGGWVSKILKDSTILGVGRC